MAAHVQVVDVGRIDVGRVGDGGGVEQADQLSEALGVTVVRGGAGEQQRLGAGRQHPGELVVERAPIDQVVALVDDHRIPMNAFEVVAVAAGVLQRVDRDDRPAVVAERVAVGGDLAAHLGDAVGVEPHQRDGEAGPQLVLELLEDVAGRDHQDLVAPAPADQLGEDQAHLQRLAQADRIGDQQAGTQPGDGLMGSPALEVEAVEQMPVGQGKVGLVGRHRGLAQHRLQVQARGPEPRGEVCGQPGLLRAEGRDVVQLGEERGLGVTHQRRCADAAHLHAIGRRGLDRPHQPLLVTDDHLGTGGDQRQQLVRGGDWHRRGSSVSGRSTMPGTAPRRRFAHPGRSAVSTLHRSVW